MRWLPQVFRGQKGDWATVSAQSPLSGYGMALVFSLLGIGILKLLDPFVGEKGLPLVILTLSVAAAAWWGGLGPGIFATVFCTLAAWHILVPPAGIGIPHPFEILRLATTAVSGFIISLLAGTTHRTLASIRRAAGRLAAELEERHRIEAVLARESRELSRSEQRLRAIFENAALGITELDAQDRITAANRRFEELIGYSQEELRGMSVHELTDPEDRPGTQQLYARLHEAGLDIADYEKRYLRRDGTSVWVHVTVSAIRDDEGHFHRAISTVEDITKRKEAEGELARSNRDLEEFAHVVSHDLQEPLRMVTNFGQLLTARHADKLNEQAREYLAYMIEGATRMNALVAGLLDYSRVGRGGPVLEEVDMRAVLEGVLRNYKMLIETTQATVDTGNMPTVAGNFTQLSQLLHNLIGNALKYRKPGVPPVIAICADRQGEEWLFSVTDNGIGIDPKHFDRLFILFQRLHSREEYPGVGIGLALCKKIVERHGGRIWVESRPGQGSTFFFTVPVPASKRTGDAP